MVGTRNSPEADSFASECSSKPRTVSFLRLFNTKYWSLLLIFLFLGILISVSVAAETQGCYLFTGGSEDYLCQDNVLESDALADCEEFGDDCDFDSMFLAGESCSKYPQICEEVICSVDCDTHTIGKCEELGGIEVEDDQYDLWCSEGCCSVGSFCEYVDLRFDCVERAIQQGFDEEDIFMAIEGVTPSSCQTNICGIELSSGSIGGFVLDAETGEAITGATIKLSSSLTDTSASNGYYSFLDVTPNSYVIQVSANGYSSSSSTISLDSSEVLEKNFSLSVAGESFSVSGEVLDTNGGLVADVSICFASDSGKESCSSSDSLGAYSFSDLQESDYTITMSKYGYTTTYDSLTVSANTNYDLVIGSIDFQGISGVTLLDENGNGLFESSTEDEVYGASIYVNGVYQGNSKYPDGNYEIYLEDGEYTIFATYQDYSSEEYDFIINAGETEDLDLLLEKEIGECSFGEENDQKSVEVFEATLTQGEAIVTLSWEKPCAEVSGYIIEKDGEVLGESFSPLAISTKDIDVDWGETITYSIVAVYTDGPPDTSSEGEGVTYRTSATATEVTVTLGSADCEGREVGSTFCLVNSQSSGSDERKSVFTCNEENQIIESSDCSRLDDDESNYFCSAASKTYALCKDAGSCSVLGQNAEPFGLYYTADSCYGSLDSDDGYASFCYFDYTEASIVDACYSCEEVVDCFDYISQDSCEINNCLGTGCSWIDSSNSSLDYGISGSSPFLDYGYLFPSSLETGHGYCVADDYGYDEVSGFDDQCGLCGPNADLFENNYCTADVCSSRDPR